MKDLRAPFNHEKHKNKKAHGKAETTSLLGPETIEKDKKKKKESIRRSHKIYANNNKNLGLKL